DFARSVQITCRPEKTHWNSRELRSEVTARANGCLIPMQRRPRTKRRASVCHNQREPMGATKNRATDEHRFTQMKLPNPGLPYLCSSVCIRGSLFFSVLLSPVPIGDPLGHSGFNFFTAKPSMTSDQPLKIMSIPMNRPINRCPERGHCFQIRIP